MSHCSRKRGFTLIELLVSLTIMLVILTVVILNQSTYTERAALINLADEIGSTVSQAQVYGIAVRELSAGSENFSSSYGLAFSLLGSGSNSAYLFFADRNGDTFYNGDWTCPLGGSSECLEKTDMQRGNYIESICAVRSSGGDECSTAKRVDITFLRPHTEAQIVFFNSEGQRWSPPNTLGVKINLKSPSGLAKYVAVYESGQISVQ